VSPAEHESTKADDIKPPLYPACTKSTEIRSPAPSIYTQAGIQ